MQGPQRGGPVDWSFRQEEPWNMPAQVTDNERVLASLCYLSQIFVPLLLPFVLLLTEEARKSRFLKHHAVHALALAALTVLYYLIVAFVWAIVAAIVGCLACGLSVALIPPVVALAYYGYHAYKGSALTVPWLTDLLIRYEMIESR